MLSHFDPVKDIFDAQRVVMGSQLQCITSKMSKSVIKLITHSIKYKNIQYVLIHLLRILSELFNF